jgi:hypothetical protein
MGFHVVVEGGFGQGECFFSVALMADDQGFHGLGVGMVGRFPQDLFGGLETCDV